MEDDKLALEEARRAQQHGSVKSQVEGEVQAEIAEHAAETAPREDARVQQVAERISVARPSMKLCKASVKSKRARGVARISANRQIIFSLCSTRLVGTAIFVGFAGSAQQRRICSVHRGRNRSVLSSVSRDRRQSCDRWRAHLNAAAGNCDYRLPAAASGHQWAAANHCSPQDCSLKCLAVVADSRKVNRQMPEALRSRFSRQKLVIFGLS